MRKLNLVLVAGILITFLIHAISGGLLLAGASHGVYKAVAGACFTFAAAHAVVSLILTVKTIIAIGRSGAHYFKDNALFWARRISGLAIVIPLCIHLSIFIYTGEGSYRPQAFTTGRFVSQILFVAALALHILTNVRPLFTAFGLKGRKTCAAGILAALSVILFLFAVAFLIYYLKWMAM